jgi:hypothetical protein
MVHHCHVFLSVRAPPSTFLLHFLPLSSLHVALDRPRKLNWDSWSGARVWLRTFVAGALAKRLFLGLEGPSECESVCTECLAPVLFVV